MVISYNFADGIFLEHIHKMITKHIVFSLLAFLALGVVTSCEKEQNYVPDPVVPEPDTPEPQSPTGTIAGLFSVSPNLQVYFSQGNLQYQASTDTWRFADNQYDFVGNANSNISNSYSGWIDLFGWGTGMNPANVGENYSAYGSFTDWGVNVISNGMGNSWRTLSIEEWMYVFEGRNTPSGILYVRARVCGVNGIILFPDDWDWSTVVLHGINSDTGVYANNVIDDAEAWTILFENNGAVFLPASGYRSGRYVYFNETDDGYWSSSYYIRPPMVSILIQNVSVQAVGAGVIVAKVCASFAMLLSLFVANDESYL